MKTILTLIGAAFIAYVMWALCRAAGCADREYGITKPYEENKHA